MPRKKKISLIEEPQEAPAPELAVVVEQEPEPVKRLLEIDNHALQQMLGGSFRPVGIYDQVTFVADNVQDNQVSFVAMLAFRAVLPGGMFVIPAYMLSLPLFRGLPTSDFGGMVGVTKPKS